MTQKNAPSEIPGFNIDKAGEVTDGTKQRLELLQTTLTPDQLASIATRETLEADASAGGKHRELKAQDQRLQEVADKLKSADKVAYQKVLGEILRGLDTDLVLMQNSVERRGVRA